MIAVRRRRERVASTLPSSTANGLTVLRGLAAIVLLVWLLVEGVGWGQLGLFVVAAASDWADGFIARASGNVSIFGKLADPVTDKLLVLGALAPLSLMGIVPWWATVAMAIREVLMTVLRFTVLLGQDTAAKLPGKAKTVLQLVAVTVCLAPEPSLGWLQLGLVTLAVAATVASGGYYLWAWRDLWPWKRAAVVVRA